MEKPGLRVGCTKWSNRKVSILFLRTRCKSLWTEVISISSCFLWLPRGCTFRGNILVTPLEKTLPAMIHRLHLLWLVLRWWYVAYNFDGLMRLFFLYIVSSCQRVYSQWNNIGYRGSLELVFTSQHYKDFRIVRVLTKQRFTFMVPQWSLIKTVNMCRLCPRLSCLCDMDAPHSHERFFFMRNKSNVRSEPFQVRTHRTDK